MVRINCPDCDRALNIPETAIGKTGRCPGCNHRFVVSVPSIVEPVEENWLDPETETSEPWPSAPTPRKKLKKEKEPERIQQRVQFWTRGKLIGAGAVTVVLLVGSIAAVWMLSGGNGGGLGGSDVAREPKHDPMSFNGDNSSTVYLREAPAADPTTWKATVEKAEDAPANLKAITPVPVREGQAVIAFAFSDPKSATAAILLDRSAWLQVSLTDPTATKAVSLTDADRQYDLPRGKNDVALSPVGERLATFFNRGVLGAKIGVVVWNRDGTKHRDFTLGQYSSEESKCHGIWFLGEDRFLVHIEQTLFCCEISTGKTVYERPLDLLGDAILSAKRTWLFASVEGGIEVIATVDGTVAGRIDIPGIAKGGGTFMAISSDGTKLAAVPFSETGLPLMIWTIADGKPTSTVVRHLNVRSKWKANNVKPGGIEPLSLRWIEGGRLLIDGRMIYEPELGGSIYEFGENSSRPIDGGIRPPDGRAWRLIAVQQGAFQQAAVMAFSDAFPGSTGYYIVASVVPPLPTKVLCMPMTSYRVEVEGTGWDSAAVRESLADGLAEHGLRVDPSAELTAVFTGQSITKQQVPAGKEVSPKWNEQLLPGQTLRELVDGYETKYEIEIRNRRGDVLWKTGSRTCSVTDVKGEGKVRGWKRATDEAAGLIPVGPALLTSGGAPSKLPLMLLTHPDGSVK